MNTIWKFELDLARNLQPLALPIGAEILHVDTQRGIPCIWAMAAVPKTNEDWTERWFEIFGTGDDIVQGMGVDRQHIGTIQLGAYVWHIFERIN